MNVKVVTSANFRKEAKKLVKKFRGLKEELTEFGQSLLLNPMQGDQLTETTFKIRLGSKSKGKGKSGGFRIITFVLETIASEDSQSQFVVTLLSIYDKSEIETMRESEIRSLIENHNRQVSLNDDDDEGS